MKQYSQGRAVREARLILEDGSEWSGFSFGKARSQAGEVVFYTGMSGYPQYLTDPGNRGLILVSSYPLSGNCGVPLRPKTGEPFLDDQGIPVHFESPAIQTAGFVVSEVCAEPSHFSSAFSLSSWFEKSNVPGIFGIDTRALVKRLRVYGSMRGKILAEGSKDLTLDSGAPSCQAEEVSVPSPVSYFPAKGKTGKLLKIAIIDCGVKASVIRAFLERGAEVIRLPWNHDPKDIEYDGLVLSNGPGDPKSCYRTIASARRAFDLKKPVFGICLGSQIMALAAGANTYKLHVGHRGQNQPCVEAGTQRCYATSQNHSYAVRKDSIPKGWEPWFTNANDNSIEGIRSSSYPFSGVLFHPSGCPGPRDTEFLFDRFMEQVKEAKK